MDVEKFLRINFEVCRHQVTSFLGLIDLVSLCMEFKVQKNLHELFVSKGKDVGVLILNGECFMDTNDEDDLPDQVQVVECIKWLNNNYMAIKTLQFTVDWHDQGMIAMSSLQKTYLKKLILNVSNNGEVSSAVVLAKEFNSLQSLHIRWFSDCSISVSQLTSFSRLTELGLPRCSLSVQDIITLLANLKCLNSLELRNLEYESSMLTRLARIISLGQKADIANFWLQEMGNNVIPQVAATFYIANMRSLKGGIILIYFLSYFCPYVTDVHVVETGEEYWMTFYKCHQQHILQRIISSYSLHAFTISDYEATACDLCDLLSDKATLRKFRYISNSLIKEEDDDDWDQVFHLLASTSLNKLHHLELALNLIPMHKNWFANLGKCVELRYLKLSESFTATHPQFGTFHATTYEAYASLRNLIHLQTLIFTIGTLEAMEIKALLSNLPALLQFDFRCRRLRKDLIEALVNHGQKLRHLGVCERRPSSNSEKFESAVHNTVRHLPHLRRSQLTTTCWTTSVKW